MSSIDERQGSIVEEPLLVRAPLSGAFRGKGPPLTLREAMEPVFQGVRTLLHDMIILEL